MDTPIKQELSFFDIQQKQVLGIPTIHHDHVNTLSPLANLQEIKDVWMPLLAEYEEIYFTDVLHQIQKQGEHFLVTLNRHRLSLQLRVGDFIQKTYQYDFNNGLMTLNSRSNEDKKIKFFEKINQIASQVGTGKVKAYGVKRNTNERNTLQ